MAEQQQEQQEPQAEPPAEPMAIRLKASWVGREIRSDELHLRRPLRAAARPPARAIYEMRGSSVPRFRLTWQFRTVSREQP
jgi:hypothetical protein